jgi:large subunit ribosomal protein L27
MAHKKAAWSAKNLRDSNPQYRGVKLFGGQTTPAGGVIIRQKWDAFAVGVNTYKGRDFTIHAAIDGVVHFSKKNIVRFDGRRYLKTVVNVVTPDQFAAAQAAKSQGFGVWQSSSVSRSSWNTSTKSWSAQKSPSKSTTKSVSKTTSKAPTKKAKKSTPSASDLAA